MIEKNGSLAERSAQDRIKVRRDSLHADMFPSIGFTSHLNLDLYPRLFSVVPLHKLYDMADRLALL